MNEAGQRQMTACVREKFSPLVSVIIPVYNVAPYLREALDSVVHQTYSNLEILIVDDGSTDGSGEICEEYRSDDRVQVIHQENRGLSAARNTGLDRAAGEYIAFLDSDDAWRPDFIEKMLEAMENMENVDITACRYEIHQRRLDSTWKKIEPTAAKGFYGREKALRALADGTINVSVWNKLYRRELWKKTRFPEGHNYEDIDTTYRIFDICKHVYFLDHPLYLHRRRPGSITNIATKKNLEDRNLAYEHLEAYIESNIPEIFSEKHLKKVRQTRLHGLIVFFVKGYIGAGEIRTAIDGLNLKDYSFRYKAALWILRFCPGVLMILYPVFRPLRLLARKVFGR